MPIAPEYLHLVYPGVQFDALLYGRVSRDPTRKGNSVSDQLDAGRELCETHGWPVVEAFEDVDRSASRYARRRRKDFEALIEAIEAGRGRIVVAWEASRYYRDLEAYLRLRNACSENGVLLCYNGQIYDLSKREDRKATAQDAIAAEGEADEIRERVLRTKRKLAKKGAPNGRILWGYARRYDPETGELIEQYDHPERGPIVTEIFERFESGETEYAILQSLRSRGERLPGIRWELHHVSSMLRNPGYIGKRVHQGVVIGDAAWPALTTEATFYAVQRILDAPERRTTNDNSVKHWLSWLGTCGDCAEKAPLKVLKNRGYLSYQCSEWYHTTIRKELLDAYVEEGLIKWLSSPAAADAFRDDTQREKAAAARIRLDALTQQLENARTLAGSLDERGNPRLSITSLASLESQLLPQIAEAQEEAEFIRSAPQLVQNLVGQHDIEERWEALSMPQRRKVVRAVVNVRLHKARARGVRKIEPGRISLVFVGDPRFQAHEPFRVRRLEATGRGASRIRSAPGEQPEGG
ncbi:recombinase family protein [Streptomyces sp. NPDC002067]